MVKKFDDFVSESYIVTAYLMLSDEGWVDIYRSKSPDSLVVSIYIDNLKSDKILLDKHLNLIPGKLTKARIDWDKIE